MKDSLSLTNGTPADGLTYCGARIYSITVPSPLPTWLAIGASTGSMTFAPTDPALGGTSATVTVHGYLSSYPTITSTVSFTMTFTSCQ